MKKGISLVVLAITIIIMTILLGVIIINTDSTLLSASKVKLQTDISQLEALMNTYKYRNNGNINFSVTQFDLSSLASEEIEQFSGENIVNNKIELYVIQLHDIDAEDVNYGNLKYGSDDRYLYSITTGKVYYEQGLLIDDIRYYHLKSGEV